MNPNEIVTLNMECTCHMGHPPCSFCTSFESEEEYEVYSKHGLNALLELREERNYIEKANIW
jgi:hypothetical protein